MLNVSDEIIKICAKDAKAAFASAQEQINLRNREHAAMYLSKAHNILSAIGVRAPNSKRLLGREAVKDLVLVQQSLRRVYRGCIGLSGLGHIDALTKAMQQCANKKWWKREF